jgi:thiamine-monophosphate kinase
MALSEFELIRRYFQACGPGRGDVLLGVGDDCALLEVPPGQVLAVSLDTLVEGVHFRRGVAPESLGYKALAVNLSDLAAMGAKPAWATLGLTLPSVDERWLEAFSRGFSNLAKAHGVQLVGGDTTRGPLSCTIQVHGFVSPEMAMRRDAAKPGDLVCVSGTLGDAGLALAPSRYGFDPAAGREALRRRLDWPLPRVREGADLLGIARCAIDISDGLASDLGHICEASGVGAEVSLERLPLSPVVRRYVDETGDWSVPIASGDDYELCITVDPSFEATLAERFPQFTVVGVVRVAGGVRFAGPDGKALEPARRGYEHFSDG